MIHRINTSKYVNTQKKKYIIKIQRNATIINTYTNSILYSNRSLDKITMISSLQIVSIHHDNHLIWNTYRIGVRYNT